MFTIVEHAIIHRIRLMNEIENGSNCERPFFQMNTLKAKRRKNHIPTNKLSGMTILRLCYFCVMKIHRHNADKQQQPQQQQHQAQTKKNPIFFSVFKLSSEFV